MNIAIISVARLELSCAYFCTGVLAKMRVVQASRYLFVICLAVPIVCLLMYYYGFGFERQPSIQTRAEDELQVKVQRLANPNGSSVWQLTDMIQENQKILEKLKVDMFVQRKSMLDRIRNEISEESAIADQKQADFQPTRKTTTLKPIEPIKPAEVERAVVIPIVITACNRPSVSRCLDKLMSVRDTDIDKFPIIVSQDCGDQATAEVLNGYGDKITFIKHDPEPVPADAQRNFVGYYKISMHYKFALGKAFELFPKAESIIILEDDIEVSPDFLSYFSEMNKLLKKDDSLWCASAWNDNGKTAQVDATEAGAEKLYRADFFPGLGWLLKRSLWEEELSSKWPAAFWDDWMREEEQRKGRSCIRPEVSRTSTFGRKGVSAGQFFDSHLKYIKLNEFPVDWSSKDLSYLIKQNYDRDFKNKVYGLPQLSLSDLQENKNPDAREVRIEYTMAHTFKMYAKELGLMTDFKAGVPRTAYMGAVTTLYHARRVYLSPPRDWAGYDKSWS